MKKIITKEQAKKIGLLANFHLSEEQIAEMSESMSSVVGYMEEIKDLTLEEVPETSRMTEEVNIGREDVVEPSFTQSEALSEAKRTYKGYFVVPYVFTDKE